MAETNANNGTYLNRLIKGEDTAFEAACLKKFNDDPHL
jgi:hypothetical protein